MTVTPRRISVLMGGFSAEREVSLVSGAAAARALAELGHEVHPFDLQRDLKGLLAHFEESRAEVVFNALHGRYGEDGALQGLLDILGLPYTHSGRLASALAMDKPTAKRLFAEAGIPVAEHRIVPAAELAHGDPLPRPYVLKPVDEGSSVGVTIVRPGDNTPPVDPAAWGFGAVMVEAFIPGRELTVAVLGAGPGQPEDQALAVTEITTQRGFYDYDAKYAAGGSRHVLPAEVPAAVAEEARRLSVLAHQTLGCRGVTRTDLRWDGQTLFVLEINTQPGLTPTSLVPEQAALVGIDFAGLVQRMVEAAQCDG
ncbi:D-alanine--D-alanine ligase [Roseospirillum parvum]|uniref:D-alanine--D-alanine ligase n=1 Tax=Roseospirillum parvum TaxID=83401 RepID=A0A1G7UD34_9PROT|nr:D-alanine--D-alanine ligase [Roseospirillum parvum]SDG44660.1 D-alanine-D-alanine ligase [Roseospirillum parvum]